MADHLVIEEYNTTLASEQAASTAYKEVKVGDGGSTKANIPGSPIQVKKLAVSAASATHTYSTSPAPTYVIITGQVATWVREGTDAVVDADNNIYVPANIPRTLAVTGLDLRAIADS